MKRSRRLVFLGVAFLVLPGFLARCPKVIPPSAGGGLLAGACVVEITPVVGVNHSDPIFMAGFDNDFPATGVHDPLWARGLVLENRGTKIAFVTLDVVGYFNNEVRTIRSLVDPALGFDSIIVTSTHNHEGPDTMGLWGPEETISGADLGYLDFVNDSVVDCIEAADAAKVPAALKLATGSTEGTSVEPWPDLVADGEILQELIIDTTPVGGPGIVHVEGDAGPIINASLPVMQLARYVSLAERGEALVAWLFFGAPFPDLTPLRETIATVTNFASHPESLGSNNSLISSDFPHYAREWLEARYGGVAIHVSADLGVLQGPLDVDLLDANGDPVPRRTFEFAERMGVLLAQQAAAALDPVQRWTADPAIEVAVRETMVEVENPFFVVLDGFGVFGRRDPVFDPDAGFFVQSEAQVVRLGTAQIAVTPNELDPQIANHYRDLMTAADHRFVFGLGNDEIGYQMPTTKFNPSCHLCFFLVLIGDEDSCPLIDTLDCGTVFLNNIGPGADPLLQGLFEEMLAELNP